MDHPQSAFFTPLEKGASPLALLPLIFLSNYFGALRFLLSFILYYLSHFLLYPTISNL